MKNREWQVGDEWKCFTVARRAGYGGAYGQTYTTIRWECQECGQRFWGDQPHRYMAEHADRGHSPCHLCGAVLSNRKDGIPRQHAWNRCPGKHAGDKIELEFVKNMTVREFR